MKKTLLILMAALSLTIATTEITQAAKAVDAWTFFSGAHLGMTIKEYNDYYAPIADTAFRYGGAPDGQRYVDFRSYGKSAPYHDWRVLVYYRESDGVIVAIEYWNVNDKFSSEMIRHLKDINKDWAGLITKLYDDGNGAELIATTAAQDKLESDVFER
jgi:hypothetical protein